MSGPVRESARGPTRPGDGERAGAYDGHAALAALRAALSPPRAGRPVGVADVLAAAAAIRDAAERTRHEPACLMRTRAVNGFARAEAGTDVHAPPGRVRGAGPARAPAPRSDEPAPPIRVLVVDDLAMLRRIVARQLATAGHVVVGEAATVAEAVARARALAPDVLLLDVHLPDGLGTEVPVRVTAGRVSGLAAGARPQPGVVFYTSDPGHACVRAAGATWPVLEKPAPAAALDRAVREAAVRRRLPPQ